MLCYEPVNQNVTTLVARRLKQVNKPIPTSKNLTFKIRPMPTFHVKLDLKNVDIKIETYPHFKKTPGALRSLRKNLQ